LIAADAAARARRQGDSRPSATLRAHFPSCDSLATRNEQHANGVFLADSSSSLTATPDAGLEVRDLHLWRGDRHLLRGVSFVLRQGELLQVMGHNGVGKTSLLRCVAGLIEPESGDIAWQGTLVRQSRDAFHRQLAYLGHVNALKPDLTALENLHFSVRLRRHVERSEMRELLGHLQVGQCADLDARSLSAGQKRRVAIARVILSGASVWILDEPITNLDTSGIECVEACMAKHLDGGGSILTAAHQSLLDGDSRVRILGLQ
jgi:heme exporter protein A